jgi:hypothetical protein
MRGLDMSIDWRTVQLFLGSDGVSEVQIDSDNSSKIRCSCNAFSKTSRCKHSKFVRNQIGNNDGHYAIQVPVDISDEYAMMAMSSAESFREFILKYGKVEVID